MMHRRHFSTAKKSVKATIRILPQRDRAQNRHLPRSVAHDIRPTRFPNCLVSKGSQAPLYRARVRAVQNRPILFTKIVGREECCVNVHDDFVSTGTPKLLQQFRNALYAKFPMTGGLVERHYGLRIKRNKHGHILVD